MWPNFLIIGAHKAGTSSLAQYLRGHPDVYIPELKEARFFAFDQNNPDHLKKGRRIFPVQTEEEYLRLFSGAKGEKAVGEATPEYLNSRFAAERIRKRIPDVKLIASLRHPVDRSYSSFLMNAREQGVGLADFRAWHPDREELERGFYFPKFQAYLEYFDRRQIKVVLFDHLKTNSRGVAQELYAFLGVDSTYEPDLAVYNKGGLPRNQLLHRLLSNRVLRQTFKRYMPGGARGAVRRLKDVNLARPPELAPEKRRELSGLFKEDILRTQDLLRVDLSRWLDP